MSGSAGLIIILAVLAAIIIGVAAYFILRFLRGSINITLSRTAFSPGDKISGSFELKTRKAIEGNRLYATLIGQEVTRTRRGGSTRTYTREIFRNEVTLEEGKTYPAGQTQRYEFEIDTPSAQGTDQAGFLNSPLGQSLQAGLELVSGRRRYLRWMVQVRLDARGKDLTSSKKVSLNTRGLV